MKLSKSTAKKNRLEKRAIKLWWELAREKWGDKCEICGKGGVIEMHHFILRSRSRLLKFDVENAVPLCKGCHYKIHNSNKFSPPEVARMVETIRKKRGKKWSNYIDEKEMSKASGFYGIHYLEGVIEELKSKLN